MIIKSNIDSNNIKYLVFDIDDTLVLWTYVCEFFKEALTSFGIPYKEEYCKNLNDSFIQAEKISIENEKATEEIYAFSHESYMPILKEYGISGMTFAKKMMSLEKDFVHSSDDIRKTLEYLSKNYHIVCLTNWFLKPAVEKLEKHGLLSYIEKIYSYEVIIPKPDKQGIELIINDYKLKCDEIVIIGDSNRDILTAINSNVKCILVDYENKKQHLYEKSDAVITKLSDIIELMNNKEE